MAQALIMSLPSGDARRTKDVWKYGGGKLSYQLPCRLEYSVSNLSSTHDNGDLLCRTVKSTAHGCGRFIGSSPWPSFSPSLLALHR
jgi:hypothetical protein